MGRKRQGPLAHPAHPRCSSARRASFARGRVWGSGVSASTGAASLSSPEEFGWWCLGTTLCTWRGQTPPALGLILREERGS